MVIRGSRFPEREVDCKAEKNKQGIDRYIVIDKNGEMQIRKGGQDQIAAKFRSFYINKMQADDYSKARQRRMDENRSDVVFKKKPYVSAASKALAEKGRGRLDDRGAVDIVDHLYTNEIKRKELKEVMAKQAIAQAAKIEEEEFTFSPKISQYNLPGGHQSGDKCFELYSRVKEGQYLKKKDVEDYDYERGKDECTGKPTINHPISHLIRPDRELNEIYGVDKFHKLQEARRE